MKKSKKLLAMLVALCMLVALFSACGSSAASSASSASSAAAEPEEQAQSEAAVTTPEAEEESAAEAQAETSEVEAASAEEEAEASPVDDYVSPFPLEEEATLTAWAMWIPGIEQYVDSPADTLNKKEMYNLTNVYIDMELASSPETAMTEINLLIASGDYPDLINNFSGYYSAGIDSAINEEIIVNVADYEDIMPNYFAKLDARDARDEATTDAGNIGVVYQVGSGADSAQSGLTLRQDWMEELGLESPETYDDLHDILMQMKDQYGTAETMFIPKTSVPDGFFDGFEEGYDFTLNAEAGTAPWNYVETDDGLEVVFGFMDDSFFDAMKLLNSWYNDGLFTADYLNHNYRIDVSDMTSGDSACVYANQDSLNSGNTFQEHMWAPYASVSEDGSPIVAVQDQFSALSAQGYSITTNCEDIELACKYLDYQYTDDVFILNNYGIEGETFEYNDAGEPVLTDLIMNNPDSIPQNYTKFIYLAVTGSFYCDSDRFKSNYCEEAKTCFDVWDSTYDYYESKYNTNNITLTTEEQEEYSATFSDISTYCGEMIAAFILGQTELNDANIEEFRTNLENMGIEDCIAIYQGAADRYVESLKA